MSGQEWDTFLRTKIGRETTVSVSTLGPVSSGELRHLIRVLEMTARWFAEDESDFAVRLGLSIRGMCMRQGDVLEVQP